MHLFLCLPPHSRVWSQDLFTQELARSLSAAIAEASGGHYAHMVINRLVRKKLDANRERYKATQGIAGSVLAWTEYHGFIDQAKESVMRAFGRGLFIDLHVCFHLFPGCLFTNWCRARAWTRIVCSLVIC